MTTEILSCIVSVCALVASIFSPVFVTFLNNRFQSKKEERDFYQRHRCEVIERYLQCTARFMYDKSINSSASSEYGSSLAEIYMYVPSDLWTHIDKMSQSIDTYVRANDYKQQMQYLDDAKKDYQELCKLFSDFSRSPNSWKNKKNKRRKND